MSNRISMPAKDCLYLIVLSSRESQGFKYDFHVYFQVENNTPASGHITHGDAIVAIGGTNAQNLTHMQAHQLIKSAGTHLSLTVLK